ncbi:hypothetical protein J6590_074820 [Homalodisca vitripennis]|nr:hypothetical protein J6590_074820 [Homalodisca vitripennis]
MSIIREELEEIYFLTVCLSVHYRKNVQSNIVEILHESSLPELNGSNNFSKAFFATRSVTHCYLCDGVVS